MRCTPWKWQVATTTLLWVVPLWLGLAHQGGALDLGCGDRLDLLALAELGEAHGPGKLNRSSHDAARAGISATGEKLISPAASCDSDRAASAPTLARI